MRIAFNPLTIGTGLMAWALVFSVCGTAEAQQITTQLPGVETLIVSNGQQGELVPYYLASAGKKRGYLGVHLMRLNKELRVHFGAPKDAGVMVAKVEKKSPAAKAGIAVGDVIVAVDGDNVDAIWQLQQVVGTKSDGEVATLKVIRNKKPKNLKVTIKERKRPKVDVGRLFHWSWQGQGNEPEHYEVEVDTEALEEAMQNLEKHFKEGFIHPKMEGQQKKLKQHKQREKELEKRLKQLEKRIKKLEKKYQTKLKRLKKKQTEKRV